MVDDPLKTIAATMRSSQAADLVANGLIAPGVQSGNVTILNVDPTKSSTSAGIDYVADLNVENTSVVDVLGSVTAGDAPTVIKLPVSQGPTEISFRLSSAVANQPLAASLQILDSSMQPMGVTTPSVTTHSLSIDVTLSKPAASAVYAKIVPPVSGGSSPPSSFPFVLEVAKLPLVTDSGPGGAAPSAGGFSGDMFTVDVTENAPAPVTATQPAVILLNPPYGPAGTNTGTSSNPPGLSSLPPPPHSTPSSPLVNFGSMPSGSDASAPSTGGDGHKSQPPTQAPLPVAVGLLPARSTTALGGVFAAADPVPPVDPQEVVQVDVALVGLAPGLINNNDPARHVVPVGQDQPGDGRDRELAAVKGPGGLPLIATALLTTAAAGAPGVAGAADGHGPACEDPDEPPLLPAPTVSPDTPSEPALAARSATKTDETPARTRRARSTSSLPGVIVALALGSGLMLPDVAAACRFASPRRPRIALGRLHRALRRGLTRF